MVAHSNTEIEYRDFPNTTSEILWLPWLLQDLEVPITSVTPIHYGKALLWQWHLSWTDETNRDRLISLRLTSPTLRLPPADFSHIHLMINLPIFSWITSHGAISWSSFQIQVGVLFSTLNFRGTTNVYHHGLNPLYYTILDYALTYTPTPFVLYITMYCVLSLASL